MRRQLERVLGAARFARQAIGYVRRPLSPFESERLIRDRLNRREARFLRMLEGDVFGNPRSPYRLMLDRAGIGLDRVRRLVGSQGIEGTLTELRDQGVYVSYEDFKAGAAYGQHDEATFGKGTGFDSPFSGAGIRVRSGGSRGLGTRLSLDVPHIEATAPYFQLLAQEHVGPDALHAAYLPPLPAITGILLVIQANCIGRSADRWFSPVDPASFGRRSSWETDFVRWVVKAGGGRAPKPEHVPLDNSRPVAEWLAGAKAVGRPCVLHAYASSCVRTCDAAREAGLDIAGIGFRMIGEPVTQAKRAAVLKAGGIPMISYGLTEAGIIGASCPHGANPDEVHALSDSLALIRHTRVIERFAEMAHPFLLTSFREGAPKTLLNVEIDDCGDTREADCGCVWGRIGFRTLIGQIRSFVKLTSEGVTFLGVQLTTLVEKELPERFGGGPSDYQVVEEEDETGKTWLTLRIAPRAGMVNEEAVTAWLLERLRRGADANRLASLMWAEAGTLRWVRMEPARTRVGKILPFHTLK